MFEFVTKRRLAFTLTGVMLVLSIAALIIPPRLPFGIEFSSGTSLTIEFLEPVGVEEVRQRLSEIDQDDASVQALNETTFFIRTEFVQEDLLTRLEEAFGPLNSTGFERSSDLAQTVFFVDTVPLEDVRAGFGDLIPDGVRVEAAGFDQFFVSAPGLDEDDVANAFATWDSIGKTTRDNFDSTAFVETFIFDEGTELQQSEVDSVLETLGVLDSVIAVPEKNTLLLAVKGLAEEAEATLVEAFETRFGSAERLAIDAGKEPVFIVSFNDTISKEQVLESLVVLPVSQAIGEDAIVSPLGRNEFLLQGDDLDINGDRVLANLEDSLGLFEQTTFSGDADLAIILNLGAPEISIGDVQSEAIGQGRMALLPTLLDENEVGILDSTITTEELSDLIEGFELRFGLAKITQYDEEGDLATRISFPESIEVAIEELRSEIELLGLNNVTVMNDGNWFSLLAKDLPADRQRDLLEGISLRFGEFADEPVPTNPGAAVVMDFGPRYSVDLLTQVVSGVSGEEVTTALDDTKRNFLLYGTDALRYEQPLTTAIEKAFGLAEVTNFDFATADFFVVRPTELKQSIEAVTNALVVQQNKPNQFFLGGHQLSGAQQGLLLGTLRNDLGDLVSDSFDFTSNVALTLLFDRSVSPQAVVSELNTFGYMDLIAEERDDGIFIRGSRAETDGRSVLLTALGTLAEINTEAVDFTSVDAEIAKRSILNTFWAVLAGTVGILLYIWWAFRRIPKSYRYGFAAIAGLAHDVLLVLGVFGLLSKFTNVEINSLMIVGVLAVIGYSVNNTIVVFDRIRENVVKSPGRAFETSVNVSLNETLTRNLNTSLTTGVAVLAVLLFGGETIRDFMGVLLAGVIAGTYSSLMLSPNILVAAEKGELPRLRLRRRRSATP